MSLCFYTVATGSKYKAYITLFLACVRRAYPEASVIVDCVGSLDDDVQNAMSYAWSARHIVNEHAFGPWATNPGAIMIARWCAYHPEFEKHDFVYYADVDLLHAAETPDLVKRRMQVMGKGCFSNSDSIDRVQEEDRRMTGLHMVRPAEYFPIMLPVMESTLDELLDGRLPEWSFSKATQCADNQKALRVMLERAGLTMPQHGFFQYHGLHVGHSRTEGRWSQLFQECPDHQRYARDLMPHLQTRAVQRSITHEGVRREMDAMMDAWAQLGRGGR